MIGQRFGKLLVVEYYGRKGKNNKKYYLCKCDCGNEKVICEYNLRNGHTKSCGCLKHKESVKRVDLSNKRFGKLTAIRFSRIGERGTTFWLCRCDCGKEIEVTYNNLKSGNTRSCGCWHETHGETGTRLYKCWQDMKSRCEYFKDVSYRYYGAKGIIVCEE